MEQYLQAAYANRKSYIEANQLEAYRLANLDEAIMGAAIDVYGSNAVVHVFDKQAIEHKPELEAALRKTTQIEEIFYKDRTKGTILKLPSSPAKKITAKEYDAVFECNLGEYLDIGLFLDHRETRQKVRKESTGKTILNTFAYTGSFSVHAALGGAVKTYSVDLSKTYCEWIKRNMELNNLPLEQNWVYKMDTLEFFRYAQRKNLMFDIIIIDPPTFSRNKKETFHVQKDHVQLLTEAGKILNKDGYIMFSNNYTEFKLDEEKLPQFAIEDLNMIPPDFEGALPHIAYELRLR